MKRIIILGGGFGGVYTAKYLLRKLRNRKDVEIILINRTNYFLFTPMLHEVATGGLNRHHIVEPIRSILDHKHKNFRFVKCEIEKIDFSKRKLYSKHGELQYDILILAIGSRANFFNVPGTEQHALCLKSIEDANRIRNTIIENLEMAAKFQERKDISPYLTFMVIGGGPTGVEVIGEVEEFVQQMVEKNYRELSGKKPKFYLIQSGEKIIPFMHAMCIGKAMEQLEKKKVRVLLNTVAKEMKEGEVILEQHGKKQTIKANTIIWAAGILPNKISTVPGVTNKTGHYEVDEYLQVKNLKSVYAIGDCAHAYNPGETKPIPALAQAAIIQAKVVAKNIAAALAGKKQKPFSFKPKGLLVSVGKGYGVAEIGKIKFKGFFAWWLMRTIYLFKLVGRANKFKVAYEWTILLFSDRDTSQI